MFREDVALPQTQVHPILRSVLRTNNNPPPGYEEYNDAGASDADESDVGSEGGDYVAEAVEEDDEDNEDEERIFLNVEDYLREFESPPSHNGSDVSSDEEEDDETLSRRAHGVTTSTYAATSSLRRTASGSGASGHGMRLYPSALPISPEMEALVDMGPDPDDDIGVSLEEIRNTLPKHGLCACHKLDLVATTDASKALTLYEDQVKTKNKFPFDPTTSPFPNKTEVTTYQKAFQQTMDKLKSIWNLQSRSVLAADSIRKNLERLFPVHNTTRWNSLYDAVAFVVEK